MKNVVVTFIGKDKAGLVDQLANLVYPSGELVR